MDYPKKIVVGCCYALMPFFTIALCILALALVPFLFIWAVNLLFETQIEFNFWNNVAIYVLLGLLNSGVFGFNSNQKVSNG